MRSVVEGVDETARRRHARGNVARRAIQDIQHSDGRSAVTPLPSAKSACDLTTTILLGHACESVSKYLSEQVQVSTSSIHIDDCVASPAVDTPDKSPVAFVCVPADHFLKSVLVFGCRCPTVNTDSLESDTIED
eukprot:6177704-Pleurochrysis_carterae.AAC.3